METAVIIFILLVIVAFFVAVRLMFVITKRLAKVSHEEKTRLKVIKLTVLWTVLTMLCLFNGCVASYCSGIVTVAKDYTQTETVGIISYRGFPVWFQRTAPGLRYMALAFRNRIFANWCVWTTVFLFMCCSLYFKRAKRKSVRLFGLILCIGCAGIVTLLLRTEANTIPPIHVSFAEIKKAVQTYEATHNGKLPDTLDELIQSSAGKFRPREKKAFSDPWGKPIEYERKEHDFTIRSSGPDRIMGTEDDITM